MWDHLDGVVGQDDGEPQARHLTIKDESFRRFQLDDSPAQPFHQAILSKTEPVSREGGSIPSASGRSGGPRAK